MAHVYRVDPVFPAISAELHKFSADMRKFGNLAKNSAERLTYC